MPRLKPHAAVLCAAVLLAGCASAPLPPPPPPSDAPELLHARYQADLHDCRAGVGGSDVLRETLDYALQGALVAAMLAWGGGADADTVRGWAWGGAALVGGSEGLQAIERRQQAVVRCMRARGHGGAPYAMPAPRPPAPAVEPIAPRVALPVGVDAYSAERLARDQACQAQPRALLAAKGPGFETYTVACSSGDALVIRCEFGNCRVLR